MNLLVIGNIVSLIGAVLMVLIGLIKDKKRILTVQNAQFAIMGIGNLLLGGVSGAVANLVSIARNLYGLRFKMTTAGKVAFILVQAALTAVTNCNGWVGWLPVAAAAAFTWVMDTPNPIKMKNMIIFGQVCWCVFDASISNYTALVFDVITIISNLAGIYMIMHPGKVARGEA